MPVQWPRSRRRPPLIVPLRRRHAPRSCFHAQTPKRVARSSPSQPVPRSVPPQLVARPLPSQPLTRPLPCAVAEGAAAPRRRQAAHTTQDWDSHVCCRAQLHHQRKGTHLLHFVAQGTPCASRKVDRSPADRCCCQSRGSCVFLFTNTRDVFACVLFLLLLSYCSALGTLAGGPVQVREVWTCQGRTHCAKPGQRRIPRFRFCFNGIGGGRGQGMAARSKEALLSPCH
jgi:hypothetical protein